MVINILLIIYFVLDLLFILSHCRRLTSTFTHTHTQTIWTLFKFLLKPGKSTKNLIQSLSSRSQPRRSSASTCAWAHHYRQRVSDTMGAPAAKLMHWNSKWCAFLFWSLDSIGEGEQTTKFHLPINRPHGQTHIRCVSPFIHAGMLFISFYGLWSNSNQNVIVPVKRKWVCMKKCIGST